MKYVLLLLLLLVAIAGRGQAKVDTIKPVPWRVIDGRHVYSYFEDKDRNLWAVGRDRQNTGYSNPGETVRLNPFDTVPTFNDIIFLMQQNKELSDRLDKAYGNIDSLGHELSMLWEICRFNVGMDNKLWSKTENRIDSLEHRPYLFIDTKGVRPGVYLTNSAGEFQIFIAPL